MCILVPGYALLLGGIKQVVLYKRYTFWIDVLEIIFELQSKICKPVSESVVFT